MIGRSGAASNSKVETQSIISLKLENDVNGVDNTRNVPQNRQQDVDEEISIAAALEEHAQGRQEDGEDELDDVASGEGHCCVLSNYRVRVCAFRFG